MCESAFDSRSEGDHLCTTKDLLECGYQPKRYHIGGYLSALVIVLNETFFIKLIKRMNSSVIAPVVRHPHFYETK